MIQNRWIRQHDRTDQKVIQKHGKKEEERWIQHSMITYPDPKWWLAPCQCHHLPPAAPSLRTSPAWAWEPPHRSSVPLSTFCESVLLAPLPWHTSLPPSWRPNLPTLGTPHTISSPSKTFKTFAFQQSTRNPETTEQLYLMKLHPFCSCF